MSIPYCSDDKYLRFRYVAPEFYTLLKLVDKEVATIDWTVVRYNIKLVSQFLQCQTDGNVTTGWVAGFGIAGFDAGFQ